MEWKEVLVELIEVVRTASESIWIMARRQAVVQGVQGVVGFVLCLLSIVAMVWLIKILLKKAQKEIEECSYTSAWWNSDQSFSITLTGVLIFVEAIIAILLLMGSIGHFVNPDFYALRMLVELASQ